MMLWRGYRSLMNCTVSPCHSDCTSLALVSIAVFPLCRLCVLGSSANGHVLTVCPSTVCTHKHLTEANCHCWCYFISIVNMRCCQNLALPRSPLNCCSYLQPVQRWASCRVCQMETLTCCFLFLVERLSAVQNPIKEWEQKVNLT